MQFFNFNLNKSFIEIVFMPAEPVNDFVRHIITFVTFRFKYLAEIAHSALFT